MDKGIEKSYAHLTIEVFQNPRTTLACLEQECCKFLDEMSRFYAKEGMKDEADLYKIGVLIHATLGMSLSVKSSKLLVEIIEFMNKKSQEYLGDAIRESVETAMKAKKGEGK